MKYVKPLVAAVGLAGALAGSLAVTGAASGVTRVSGAGTTTPCAALVDTVAPQVMTLQLSPTAVSVERGPAVVHVAARVIDTEASGAGTAVPGSGAARVTVDLEGAAYAVEGTSLHLSSGSAQDGIWRGTIHVARREDPSAWFLVDVVATDRAGNAAVYPSFGGTRPTTPNDAILQAHWERQLVVKGTPRPQRRVHLLSLTMSRHAVDTRVASAAVTVDARIRGPVEPAHTLSVGFTVPGSGANVGGWLRHLGGQRYRARVVVPRGIGSHRLRPEVYAAYFWHSFDSSPVKGKAITARLLVVAHKDTVGPRVTALTVTPTSVNTVSHRQRVTVTATLNDAGSGVAPGGYVVLHAAGRPFPDAVVALHRHGAAWRGTTMIPTCVGSASWQVQGVFTDRVGNYRSYSSSQLAAAGLPSTLAVTSGTGDRTPPEVTNDQGPINGDVVHLQFSEGVRNVTSSSLTVYKVGEVYGDYRTALTISSITCRSGGVTVPCSGADGSVRSASLTVPAIKAGWQVQVWANQHSVVPQLSDAAGNPMDWSLFVAHYVSQ